MNDFGPKIVIGSTAGSDVSLKKFETGDNTGRPV